MVEQFDKELSFIKNEDIKEFLENAISKIPSYFWEMSSSTTNRYHPAYALGNGGLVRHTKAATQILYDLLNLELWQQAFTERQRDLILAAIILHDSHKKGDGSTAYTVHEHPILAANFVRGLDGLSADDKEYIAQGIASHMGQWNTNNRSKFVLDKPTTSHQKIIHMADYLASRKYLEFQFEGIEIPKPVAKQELEDPGEYVFTFGKHKGKSIKELSQADRGYLTWLIGPSCTMENHVSQTYIKKFFSLQN